MKTHQGNTEPPICTRCVIPTKGHCRNPNCTWWTCRRCHHTTKGYNHG